MQFFVVSKWKYGFKMAYRSSSHSKPILNIKMKINGAWSYFTYWTVGASFENICDGQKSFRLFYKIFFLSFFFSFFFIFSYQYIVEKVLFWKSNFRNGDFDGFTLFWDALIQEITFLASSMYIRMCVCVCVPAVSVIQKQITVETSNSIYYIGIICRYNLKLFMKIGQKLCV